MRTCSRRKALGEWPQFPTITWDPVIEDLEYSFPATVSSRVLWLEARSVRGVLRDLALGVRALDQGFDSSGLIFFGAD